MSDGLMLVLFIIGLFLLWLFVGGQHHPGLNQPLEKPYTEQINGAYIKN